MSDKIITVGLWRSAPFGGSILRGIETLNTFLKSENLDLRYEPVRLESRNLPAPEKTPDILILDGGEDVNPNMYGQKNTHSSFNDARDAAEFALIRHFSNYGRRMSGVCRGHQLLNVYYGGSLIQDIHASGRFTEDSLKSHKGGHKVRLKRPYKRNKYMSYGGIKKAPRGSTKKGHIISRFVGVNPFTVSSMHHQAIKSLGEGLGVSLSFGGGKKGRYYIVEGIESSNGRIRGVQSHPEFSGYPKDGVMFSYLMHIDKFVDDLFEPDMEEVEARLKEGGVAKKLSLPFDMQNVPPAPPRRRNREDRPDEAGIFVPAEQNRTVRTLRTDPTFTVGTNATWNDDNGTDNR